MMFATVLSVLGACAPPEDEPPVLVSAAPLQRLTRSAWASTLGAALGPQAAEIIEAKLWQIPDDAGKDRFDRQAVDVTAAHVQGWMATTEEAVIRIARDPALRSELTGCGGPKDGELECLRQFVDRFGHLAWRRPLTDTETAQIMDLVADAAGESPAEAVEVALLSLLLSPHFLYRLEVAGPQTGPNQYALTSFEQVTRLAFALWGRGPTEGLLEAASTVDRFDAEALRGVAAQMLRSPLARGQIQRFYREWLDIRYMEAVRAGAPFIPFEEQAGLQEDMTAELEQVLEHHTFEATGTYADLMTSKVTAVHSDNLARIYGGKSAPLDGQVNAPGDVRAGLLTRPGMLVATREETSPVRRGVFVLERLLCEELGSPDPALFSTTLGLPPPADGVHTNRERWAARTSAPQCASCHEAINAFGFTLEAYDSAGRYRTEEYSLPSFQTGGIWLPIDDTAEVPLDGQRVTVQGAAGLGRALAASQAGPACMARQWFRFAAGRHESPEDAAAHVLIEQFGANVPIIDMMAAFAATPELQVRRVAP